MSKNMTPWFDALTTKAERLAKDLTALQPHYPRSEAAAHMRDLEAALKQARDAMSRVDRLHPKDCPLIEVKECRAALDKANKLLEDVCLST